MSVSNFYYITVATISHPILEKLKKNVKEKGETIEVLGEQEKRVIGWENQQRFGIKLREVSNFLKRPTLNPEDIILFTDGFDVAYFGTKEEILRRYYQFNHPIVFGCETDCWPDPNRVSEYMAKNATKAGVEFPYLNSGMFIGTVDALRKCIINYNYNDKDDDQRYWTTQYLENPQLITLDYYNFLFLNTSGYQESFFTYDIENNVAYYKASNPQFVHVNGPDKSFINQLY